MRVGTGRGDAEGPSCGAGVGSLGAAGSAGCVGAAAAVGHPPCVVNVASTLAVLLSARRRRCCT